MAALLRVSTALGLTPRSEKIDLEKVRAVNSARVKAVMGEMAAPTAVSMAKYAKPRDTPAEQWKALLEREKRLDKALTVKPKPKHAGPSTQVCGGGLASLARSLCPQLPRPRSAHCLCTAGPLLHDLPAAFRDGPLLYHSHHD